MPLQDTNPTPSFGGFGLRLLAVPPGLSRFSGNRTTLFSCQFRGPCCSALLATKPSKGHGCGMSLLWCGFWRVCRLVSLIGHPLNNPEGCDIEIVRPFFSLA